MIISGKSGLIKVDEKLPSLIIENCKNLTVDLFSSTIKGTGGGKQKPLIAVIRSKNVKISNATLVGDSNDSSKQAWKNTAPNGILICPFSKKIAIENIAASRLHMGVVVRGEGFSIEKGEISFCSGDFIHCQADNFSIVDIDMRYSLEVWDYNEIHRDAIQVYQYKEKYKKLRNGKAVKVLSNGSIKGNLVYFPADPIAHQFCKTADGIMGTDGVFENIEITGNRIFIENQNGIRFAPMFNSKILNDNEVRHARFFK